MSREEQSAFLAEEKQETIWKYSLLVVLHEGGTTENKTMEYVTVRLRHDTNVRKKKTKEECKDKIILKTNKNNSTKLCREMWFPNHSKSSPQGRANIGGCPPGGMSAVGPWPAKVDPSVKFCSSQKHKGFQNKIDFLNGNNSTD